MGDIGGVGYAFAILERASKNDGKFSLFLLVLYFWRILTHKFFLQL